MSGNQPVVPQRRELEIMRVLFDRRLKDRAVVLANSRWPGSGKMVDLAYEWGRLDQTERRERLSAIGPEEIARLREFAELNPDLSKAVAELDHRGVLPHVEAAAIDVAAAARETQEPEPVPEPPQDTAVDTGPPDEQPAPEVEEAEGPSATDNAGMLDRELSGVEISDLDLGDASIDEFLAQESERREQAARAAEESMERVRRNLDQAAQRAFQRSASFGTPKMPEISRPSLPSTDLPLPSGDSDSTTRAIEAPRSLAQHLQRNKVVMVGRGDRRPSDDELVALANDLQIGFTEHNVSYDSRKEAFGGLVSEFGRIIVKPGSIPKAIAGPNLVVIRGRLSSQLADRIEAGYLDIPGTRASVEVHPKARVVVLGDR